MENELVISREFMVEHPERSAQLMKLVVDTLGGKWEESLNPDAMFYRPPPIVNVPFGES